MIQYGLPSFDEIERALASRAPMAWNLQTKLKLSIVTEPQRNSLRLLCELETPIKCPVSPSKAISIETRDSGANHLLSIGSERASLHSVTYSLIGGLVHRLESTGQDLLSAIDAEFMAWSELLKREQYLGLNQQVGLLGELWVLWRVVHSVGPQGLDAWLGPTREPHDFRLRRYDIEVKTTTEPSRTHTISSLQQLTIKPGRGLCVLSLQLQPSGTADGVSLAVAAQRLHDALSPDSARQTKYVGYLNNLGFSFEDAEFYQTSFNLRSLPTLIPVDETFPRIQQEDIQTALGSMRSQRILSASYRVSLEGLGIDASGTKFIELLPKPTCGDLYA